MAGCDDPPDADLSDPEDAAGERLAGRRRWVGEAESDQVGFVHCWIPNLPDHSDQVWNAKHNNSFIYCFFVLVFVLINQLNQQLLV